MVSSCSKFFIRIDAAEQISMYMMKPWLPFRERERANPSLKLGINI